MQYDASTNPPEPLPVFSSAVNISASTNVAGWIMSSVCSQRPLELPAEAARRYTNPSATPGLIQGV